ncbi:MAG: AsmA family protein [Gammaproteobacteria bacterium]|nr:AsmA family protein [Gammaproteobacteria bacterium]MBU1447683.1 AsmA family protein [Gammaproteobacteria bacterium]
MKSVLKYALWSLFGIAATMSTVLAYVALTFDPNAYKPQIIQAVQDSTHRTLKLDGDIKLMFFPSIGAHLGKVSLSEFQSEREFASVTDASVSLAVWPLLMKQMVVNQLHVNGVKINVIKYKSGKTNLDDLLSPESKTAQNPQNERKSTAVAFDVASVVIENCELQFDDQAAGSKFSITQLNLKTGRLTNAIPTPVELSARIQTTEGKADITLQVATALSFDLERNRYSLKGMELNAAGGVQDVSELMLKLAGDASADLQDRNFELNLFVLNASGKKAGDPFEAHLAVPSISLKGENFSGRNLAFNASYDAQFGKASASLNLPSFNGNLDKFSLPGMSLQAGLVQAEQAFSAKINTALIGSMKTMQFNLKELNIALKASGDKLPGKVIESSLKGSVQADLERQSVHAKFAGGLMQSQLKLEAALRNFKVPALRYDIEIDKLDLDPYLPPRVAKTDTPNVAEAEQPFDLSALQTLDVNGSVRIGALQAGNVELSKLRVDLKARDGVVNVEPLSAVLYQGSFKGKARIDAHSSSFEISQKLNGVEIAPLMKDAADLELAEGKGNISLTLDTQGNTVSALKKALHGTVVVELADGAIRGIDLGKLVQGVQNLSKDSKAETMGINKDARTQFSEFKASLKIKDGVAHNDDLSVKSTVLRLTGSGYVDIGQDMMDYNAKVIMAKTDQGRTGTLPVRFYGPFDSVKIKVDYAELLADLARQRINEEKAALKQKLDAEKTAARAAAKARLEAEKAAAKAKVEDKLKQGLKGLFK